MKVPDRIDLNDFPEFLEADPRFRGDLDLTRARRLLDAFPGRTIDFAGKWVSLQAPTGFGKSKVFGRLLPVFLWEKFGARSLIVTLRKAHLKEAAKFFEDLAIPHRIVLGRDNYTCQRIGNDSGLPVAQFCRKPHIVDGQQFLQCAYFDRCPAILAEKGFFEEPIGLTTIHKLIMTGQIVDSESEFANQDETATSEGRERFLEACAATYDLLIVDESDQLLDIVTGQRIFAVDNRTLLDLERLELAWEAGSFAEAVQDVCELAGLEPISPAATRPRYQLKKVQNLLNVFRAMEARVPALTGRGGPYGESHFLDSLSRRELAGTLSEFLDVKDIEMLAFRRRIEALTGRREGKMAEQLDRLNDLRRKLFGVRDKNGRVNTDALDTLLMTPEQERDSVLEYHRGVSHHIALRGLHTAVSRTLEPFKRVLFLSATNHIPNPRTFVDLPATAKRFTSHDSPPGADRLRAFLLREGRDLSKNRPEDFRVQMEAQGELLASLLAEELRESIVPPTLVVTTNYDEARAAVEACNRSLSIRTKADVILLDSVMVEEMEGVLMERDRSRPKVYVSPASTISRGFNILDSSGKALLHQVIFFSVPHKPFDAAAALLLLEYLTSVKGQKVRKGYLSLRSRWTSRYSSYDALVTMVHAIGRAFRGDPEDWCVVVMMESRFARLVRRFKEVQDAPAWVVDPLTGAPTISVSEISSALIDVPKGGPT